MINFQIQSERKSKDIFKMSVKGQVEGNGLALKYEVVELLEKLDEIDDGTILCDALEIFIKRKAGCEND